MTVLQVCPAIVGDSSARMRASCALNRSSGMRAR
jgi:hypothetical protein